MNRILLPLFAILLFALAPLAAAPRHGIAMYGDLKYPPGFTHFEYADPKALKGGMLRLADIGAFDNLNPFILKGTTPGNIGLLFDTLTAHANDEPFSEYGLVAETIEMPEDRSWVQYNLRPQARFHDGSPITPEDVIFTLNLLKKEGHPFYRAYYASVLPGERVGKHGVRFRFKAGENRELPLILGQMPVLSKQYYSEHPFNKTTLEAPLGSGPYRVAEVEPGRSITYERVPDYWGKDLPVNRGRYNFDRVRVDVYRDATVALEAFKAGEYDFRNENSSKNWASGYASPALKAGMIVQEEIPSQSPTGMQGYVFNTRRAIFQDPRVREALAYAFDFGWSNKTLFNGAYTRTRSYFSNSELASRGLPNGAELAILEKYRGRIPDAVFNQPYRPPATDGSGRIRHNLRTAVKRLKQAGWVVKQGKLVNLKTGQPLRFEILLSSPAFERVTLPFAKNLKRLGIDARVRTVDPAQYQNRVQDFDFDMIVGTFGQSLSPGNEQRNYWTSAKAQVKGSRNLAGIHDPVVDELVDQVIAAPDRASLVARTRALDRVLLWGHYVIPQWHLSYFRVAYWDRFDRPEVLPEYSLDLFAWWIDPAKSRRVDQFLGR